MAKVDWKDSGIVVPYIYILCRAKVHKSTAWKKIKEWQRDLIFSKTKALAYSIKPL